MSMPQAGDVIFIYSGGPEAHGSCLLQRMIFDDIQGPWFSHVAIALSRRIAIEANTEPEEDEVTWSGVTLDKGVRLRLLPDILMPTHPRIILRHPNAINLAANFSIAKEHIALLFGSGYSTKPLVDAGREVSAVLAKIVPQTLFDWNAAPDQIAQSLRDNPQLHADIERHLSPSQKSSALTDYFCSQLVGVLLWRGGLLQNDPGAITPCGLFDQLVENGWHDVTESDYGTETLSSWQQEFLPTLKLQYEYEVHQAKIIRELVHTSAMLKAIKEKTDNFSDYLDVVRKKFI